MIEYLEGSKEVKLQSLEDVFKNGKGQIVIRMRNEKGQIVKIYSCLAQEASYYLKGEK